MWEPCVGTGGDEPAFLPPGDQERPPGGSACPDSEGEARDEDRSLCLSLKLLHVSNCALHSTCLCVQAAVAILNECFRL